MARSLRIDTGGLVYHVLNRANARATIFQTKNDYKLFEDLLEEGVNKGMKILAYCVMPNHWHLVCQTEEDGDLASWMKWLSQTHAQNWLLMHDRVGTGHLYQGRYKSFPVQTNEYLMQLLRYVERNPVRAKIAKDARDWQWGSMWRREHGTVKQQKLLTPWPLDMPADYLAWVNEKDDSEQLKNMRAHVAHNTPYGRADWWKGK